VPQERNAGAMPRGVAKADLPTKPCASCGRTITWRKAWARDWEQVRHCSDSCRRSRRTDIDDALERAIIDLLNARARGATICPSEAARAVCPEGQDWHDLMEPARRAARRLVVSGAIVITQGGRIVDPSTAKGAIRLRLAR
jgi:hypothetical protein